MIEIRIENCQYPDTLRRIKNPPKQLYLEGNIELLNKNSIAIIGSRNCSENGKILAKKFAKELVEQGLTIISGMAKGIDSHAHIETLNNKGNTIAVLGNGFNNIFPKENINLYRKIIESNGLIISEYPPNVKAKSEFFLERNRIVSGLSIGILVIEAAYRSGTSVTARIAKEQGKKIFVLPHEIGDIHGVGTNNLIRKGATLVTSTKEIIKEYDFLKYKKISKKENLKIEFKTIEEKQVYLLLKSKITNMNIISDKLQLPINKINEILFMLELHGYIKKKKGVYECI